MISPDEKDIHDSAPLRSAAGAARGQMNSRLAVEQFTRMCPAAKPSRSQDAVA
jgi:hypothetical protein